MKFPRDYLKMKKPLTAKQRSAMKASAARSEGLIKRGGTGSDQAHWQLTLIDEVLEKDAELRKRGNPGRKAVRLKNFTGTIRKNANGTVSIVGRAKRK